MGESKKVLLVDSDGNTLAELLIADEEEGWFTGRVVWQRFPPEVKKALAWYDEVLQDQMLSYLDEATTAVQGFKLQVKFHDGLMRLTYSLHISPSENVSFRISPELPPSMLPREAIR